MSEPVGTPEGQAALRDYLRRERERQTASDNLLDALRTAASAFSEMEESQEAYVEEARQRARDYCEARNKNLRPVRPVDPNNQSALEGQCAALEYVERRRRSVIPK
jgi:hypothetical protein